MRKGDLGAPVATLQRQLNAAGFKVERSSIFDSATESAVMALQRKTGLVVDGIAGRKTLATLIKGVREQHLLGEADIIAAAGRLGVKEAAIKAIINVESRGYGFLDDGRPVILYERHVMFDQLQDMGLDAADCATRWPNLVNTRRGGYSGGTAEYARLQAASQIDHACALASCSWGQFQIMGFHWSALGFPSIDDFVAAMEKSEAAQLDAFVRFIEADPELHKALKALKWPVVARIYNGPDYKDNLYDVKLQRAYQRFSPATEALAA